MYKLYNGDCLEVMDNLIKEKIKVDAIISDIPYFNVVDYSWDIQWKNEDEYLIWVEQCCIKMNKLLKDNGSILIFTSRQANRKISNILDKYFNEKRIIIWARKRCFNNTRGKSLSSGYEPICYYTKGESYTFNNLKVKVNSNRKEYTNGILKDGVSLSDVWTDIPSLPHNSKEKIDHPTQKPIALMKRCVELITKENDTVLDFTMGSGSTIVACINTNRNAIGIELDKKYFDIAEKRIKDINSTIFNLEEN